MSTRSDDEKVRKAKQRAADYKAGQRPGEPTPQKDRTSQPEPQVRSVEEWTDIIGQRIEEAVRRGAFDNLSGQGKPLDLSRDQFVPEDQRMAFKLLQNNDLVPAWIGERTDVFDAVAKFRRQIETTIAYLAEKDAQTDDSVEQNYLRQTWQGWVTEWEETVRELNQQILTLNLKQPTIQLEVVMLRLNDELRKQGANRYTWSSG